MIEAVCREHRVTLNCCNRQRDPFETFSSLFDSNVIKTNCLEKVMTCTGMTSFPFIASQCVLELTSFQKISHSKNPRILANIGITFALMYLAMSAFQYISKSKIPIEDRVPENCRVCTEFKKEIVGRHIERENITKIAVCMSIASFYFGKRAQLRKSFQGIWGQRTVMLLDSAVLFLSVSIIYYLVPGPQRRDRPDFKTQVLLKARNLGAGFF